MYSIRRLAIKSKLFISFNDRGGITKPGIIYSKLKSSSDKIAIFMGLRGRYIWSGNPRRVRKLFNNIKRIASTIAITLKCIHQRLTIFTIRIGNWNPSIILVSKLIKTSSKIITLLQISFQTIILIVLVLQRFLFDVRSFL